MWITSFEETLINVCKYQKYLYLAASNANNMKQAQLIKREEKTLYISNGEIISLATDTEKMAHVILGGETKLMVTEEVVERWRVKTQKQAEPMFWNYMEEHKADFRNYYIVFAEN